MTDIHFIDAIIIIVYLLAIMVIGFSVGDGKRKNITEYFLAGRYMNWLVLGVAMFATSSEQFLGLLDASNDYGFIVVHFLMFGALSTILLSFIFGPLYLKSTMFTTPGYISRRFNNKCGSTISVISMITYVVTKFAIIVIIGSYLLKALLGFDIYASSLIIVGVTSLYAIAGGQKAVIYTEAIQGIVFVIGVLLLTIVGVTRLDSIGSAIQALPEDSFSLFDHASNSHFPTIGVLIGIPIISIWYHCTDQFMTQKFMSAKNIGHAKRASLFNGYLKVIPVFVILIPGLITKVLYPEVDSHHAFIDLTMDLPIGIKGIVVCGILAAIMSSLSACLNSCSTLFTFNIYRKMYPKANDFQLVLIGKVFSFAIIILGLIWVVMINRNTQMFIYSQSIIAYIAPPIVVLFLGGVLWTRANSKAAQSALFFGLGIGLIKVILEVSNYNDWLDDGFFKYLAEINFLYFSVASFLCCTIILYLVSVNTIPPARESLNALTLKYREEIGEDQDGYAYILNMEGRKSKKKNVRSGKRLVVLVIAVYVLISAISIIS